MTTLERFKGCLLGMAIGDAIGELAFAHPRRADLDGAVRRAAELVYTDDTAMGLALAEALAERGTIDPEHLGGMFRAAFEREPWRGYGPGPPTIFSAVGNGEVTYTDAARRLYGGQGSLGNGAAMRVAPVGLLFHDSEALAEQARASAIVTHAHPVGIDGAVALATTIALAMDKAPIEVVDVVRALKGHIHTEAFTAKLDELTRVLADDISPERAVASLGPSVAADESVPYAIYCFLRHPDDYEACLRCAVGHGGDRDTLGAMACAITGARLGPEAIPAPWRERIENRAYIEALAGRLWKKKEGM